MTKSKVVRVGTRGSGLALHQTKEVMEQLSKLNPDREFAIQTLKTQGDVAAEAPFSSLGRGIFVKEIERALLEGEIDIAVHSLKDLPTTLPEGLTIGAVCSRADARDALVNRWDCSLQELPSDARIGTSSPRRFAQLKAARPDVEVLAMRGNIDTRLRKARDHDYDGAILAAAGLIRLGLQAQIAEFLATDRFVPAPGQGALAVEVRQEDYDILALIKELDHGLTRRAVTAERAFLESLGGGCQTPVGAYARVDGETLVLTAFIASPDGSAVYTTKASGRASNPHEVALDAHQRLVEKGAGVLLGVS